MGRKTGTILSSTLEKYQMIDDLYSKGLNAHQISKEINMNAWKVGKYLKSKGAVLHPYGRKHNADFMVFRKIDSEEKAYWLGFLFADGSVSYKNEVGKPKRYVLELGLSIKDRDHLEKFRNFIGCTSEIKEREVKLGNKVHLACRLQVFSKCLVEDLMKIGCVPKKSLVLEFPKLDKEFERHFIRGYFDGDGGFHERTIEIIGTKSFLAEMQKRLGTNKAKYKPHGKAFGLRLHGNDLREFYKYVYTNATVYLERKYVAIALYVGNDILRNPNNG